MEEQKCELAIMQSHTLRGIVDAVNKYNQNNEDKILKEDIVDIVRQNDFFFLLYYRKP